MENIIFNNRKIIDIRTLIIETDMNTFCRTNKIHILKFKKDNYNKISKEISKLSDKDNIEKVIYEKEMYEFLNSLDCTGRPDYFIWNNKDFYFAEYKSRYDYLRESQYKWIKKYYKIFSIILIQSSNLK